MLAYCTYCSAEKNYSDKLLPAVDLYISERIAKVYDLAEKAGLKFVILSGKFGIMETHQKIGHYDHLLNASEVETHSDLVASQLKEKKITHLVFYRSSMERDKNIKPYSDCILEASAKIGIPIEFRDADFNDRSI
ncbi:MAG: hypothetical protein ACI9RU_002908 [Litorivivens sp.]|jgi:hypothetical protein